MEFVINSVFCIIAFPLLCYFPCVIFSFKGCVFRSFHFALVTILSLGLHFFKMLTMPAFLPHYCLMFFLFFYFLETGSLM